ncbi:hypothetical protein QFZ77_006771 [Paenibacillus sp. V4I3]|uniref:hypothetical protein n=1 Tax=unclassified Paenibacillus TaxID=185978 RepID=UPI00278754AB|nr:MULTISPECIES: hypothetical protein [unclassified Paenibacillus]MDQ0878112.1 hypothetical protein [Paenibacillus sp. V4I3]MDQ0886065.1 hypothetical protein [Paenibacillus sp. V4I9]
MIQESDRKDVMNILYQLVNGQAYSLLDVGCGLFSHVEGFECPVIVGVDAHRPYLANRVNRSPHLIPIWADATQLNAFLMPKSFSMALFNDSLEHFSKQNGLKLLAMAEEIAVKRVIVFTPRGYFKQAGYDYYNMQGETHQEHRSGWEAEELEELGYQVLILKGLHDRTNLSFVKSYGVDHPPIDALIAWKDL